jgi:hypothetical protein
VARGICGLRRRRVLGFEAGGHRLSLITDGNRKADCSFNEKITGFQLKRKIRLKVIGSRAARKIEKLVGPGSAQFGAEKKSLRH